MAGHLAQELALTRPISAERLIRKFGGNAAVNGIDLEVAEGEIFGLLGPNGAGKTTTVHVLTTLLRPTGGSARILGLDVVGQAPRVRRLIGAALQEAALDPLMTGNELMRLQAALHGLPRGVARARTEELLDRFGLAASAGARIRTYSGGTKRRLDLALALLHRPRVLFLDEPTTGIDPTSRLAVWDEIRALSVAEGTTVFLTTQYLEEADKLCGRIAIMDHGVIVRQGSPATLKAEVDVPTVRLTVPEHQRELAAGVAAAYGPARQAPAGSFAIGLAGGTASMAAVIRALDEAGVVVEHLQLDAPSLDEVFARATGRRLADDPPGEPDHAGAGTGSGTAAVRELV